MFHSSYTSLDCSVTPLGEPQRTTVARNSSCTETHIKPGAPPQTNPARAARAGPGNRRSERFNRGPQVPRLVIVVERRL